MLDPTTLRLISPEMMVQRYLAHPNIINRNSCPSHFDAAVKVFVRREYVLPNPAIAKQSLSKDSPACDWDQDATTASGTHEPAGLDAVLDRLRVLRLQLSENKKRYEFSIIIVCIAYFAFFVLLIFHRL